MSATGMPGDRGLPALGLMMQLWAGLDALLHLILGMVLLRMPGALRLEAALMLTLGLVRAFVHFVAGLEIRGGGMRIVERVRALLVVSLLYFGALMWMSEGPTGQRVLLASDALAWPLLLAVLLHTPSWRERLRKLREGELQLRDPNRSIEAAGAIMVALGTVGAVLSGSVCVALLDEPLRVFESRAPGLDTMLLLSAAALLARGLFHVGVGVVALRGATPSRFHHLVSMYVKVCWATLVVAVAPVLYGIVENVPLMGTLAVSMITMLGLWPVVLRAFAVQVGGEFGELDDQGHAPAPDGGLVAAGWLLCAVAAGSVVQAVVALLHGSTGGAGVGMLQGSGWFIDSGLPVWTGILGVAITLWAGLEMIAFSSRARIAALVFAAATIGVALWSRLDALGSVGDGMAEALVRIQVVFLRADLLASLVVPLVVAVLALRNWRKAAAA